MASHKEQLRSNEVSIEFIKFRLHNGKKWTKQTLYSALLIRHDSEFPLYINLFEEKNLQRLFSSARKEKNDEDFISLFYNQDNNNNLYDIIWANLESHLVGIERSIIIRLGYYIKWPSQQLEMKGNFCQTNMI